MFFGASGRELVDRGFGIYPGYAPYPANFWFVAPALYLTMFAFTLLLLAFVFEGQRRFNIPYWKTLFGFGWALGCYNLALIAGNFQTIGPLVHLLTYFIASMIFVLGFCRLLSWSFIWFEGNWIILAAHLWDASATFVGVSMYGLAEKHVLPTLLINTAGTAAVMFPLKVLFVLPALYLVDRDLAEDATSRRLVKIIFFILGAGPGIRDIVLMVLG